MHELLMSNEKWTLEDIVGEITDPLIVSIEGNCSSYSDTNTDD